VNLRTGGLMIGIMTLALSVFSIIPMSISLVNRDYLSRMMTHMLNKFGRNNTAPADLHSYVDLWGSVRQLTVAGEDLSDDPTFPDENHAEVVRLRKIMFVFFIACIVLLVVYLVLSILLMYASVKGKRWFILPWLIATLLFILAYMVGMIFSTILFGISLLSMALLLIAITESIIALYLWMCVVSLFQHLADRNNANQTWELQPRFNTNYKGIPQQER